MKRSLTVAVFLLLAGFSIALAQVPATMNYQGVLHDGQGAAVANGNYNLTFRIYGQPSGGVELWSETQTVSVQGGIFSIILGSVNPINIAFSETYWLGVTNQGNAEFTPRRELTTVPYSFRSRAVSDAGVTGLQGVPVNASAPAPGQVLKFDGVEWGPGSDDGGGGGDNDWTVSGNDQFSAVSGNVGIGIPTPTQKLDVLGNFKITGSAAFFTGAGGLAMEFAPNEAGDLSAVLPNDAINSTEVLNEAGVASESSGTGTLIAAGAGIVSILSRTIIVPSDGYVLVMATTQLSFTHVSGLQTSVNVGVSDIAGTLPLNQDVAFFLGVNVPSGLYGIPATVHGLFPVSAGIHTFYFLGGYISGAEATAIDTQLSLMFVPTAYGTVTPPVNAGPSVSEDEAAVRGGLTEAEIAAERMRSQADNAARVQAELDVMRERIEELQRKLAAESRLR